MTIDIIMCGLIAISLVCIGVIVLFLAKTMDEMNRMADSLEASFKELKAAENESKSRTKNYEAAKNVVEEAVQKYRDTYLNKKINVVEKPLDFPNDHKED